MCELLNWAAFLVCSRRSCWERWLSRVSCACVLSWCCVKAGIQELGSAAQCWHSDRCCVHNASTVPWTSAGQFGHPRGVRGRPWYDLWRPRCVIYHPMDVRGLPPRGVRPADGPGTPSLASTGPFPQAAVHRASGLLRFSQSQRGRIMDRKWGCPQYVRNRKLMSRSCPGNATATLLAALTFFVKNKLILL